MSQFRLFLFGPPRLTLNGKTIQLPARKIWALLAYLAVTGQPQGRDHLAALLWPAHSQPAARSNLRRELSRLHAVLGDELLAVERETVTLHGDIRTSMDVMSFQAGIGECNTHGHAPDVVCPICEAMLQDAVALYAADFLNGFTLSDCPEFDEWQYFQLQGLRGLLTTALEKLVASHQRNGRIDSALAYARRWLSLDSLHEPTHRYLMQLYAQSGQRAAALRQFEECQRTLRKEIGGEPEAETVALYEAIRTRNFPNTPPVANAPHPSFNTASNQTLPVQLTALVGREQELAALDDLLAREDIRLITIVGPGGIGKTRLALEFARRLDAKEHDTLTVNYSHGTCFVALAALSETTQILPALAAAMSFTLDTSSSSTRTPHEQVLDYLREKSMLLVLDNFEHLLQGVPLLADILQEADKVKVLVTSRERLRMPVEQVYPISGLMVSRPPGSANGAKPAAVTLFAQCCRHLVPELHFSEEELETITRICQMVDGFPLAIELAAAWADTLSPAEMEQEVSKSLDFLAAERRGVPDRHASMRAVFDSTWQRLPDDERRLFASLSVFRGGFTREAAEAVAGATLHQLGNLTAKSLIHYDRTRHRYTLHELLRQYGGLYLAENPNLEQSAHNRHCAYYLILLQKHHYALKGVGQRAALALLDIERENLSPAWRWSIEQGEIDLFAVTIDTIGLYYNLRHLVQEGFSLFFAASVWLKKAGIPRLLAHALSWQACFLITMQRYQEAGLCLETSLALLKDDALIEQDVRTERAFALLLLGKIATWQGLWTQHPEYDQCLALYEELDEQWFAGQAHLGIASLRNAMGDLETQRTHLQAALVHFRQIENERGIALALSELASTEIYLGRPQNGLVGISECLAVLRELEDRTGVLSALCIQVHAQFVLGDIDAARKTSNEALLLANEMGMRFRAAHIYNATSLLEMVSGDYDLAQIYVIRALEVLGKSEDHPLAAWFLAILGWVSLYANNDKNVGDALAILQKAVVALDNGAGTMDRGWGYGLLSFVEWRALQTQSARTHCVHALRLSLQVADPMVAAIALTSAMLLLAGGEDLGQAMKHYLFLKQYPFCGSAAWWLDTADAYMQAQVTEQPLANEASAVAMEREPDWWERVSLQLAELQKLGWE